MSAQSWRHATEAVHRQAYRHCLVHNLSLYGCLPPLAEFTFRDGECPDLYCWVGEYSFSFIAFTRPGNADVVHSFKLLLWHKSANSFLELAADRFRPDLQLVSRIEDLP